MPFFANKFPYLSRVSDKAWASSVPEWMEKEANSRAVLCHKRKGNRAGELLWSNKIPRGRGGPGDQLCRCLSWAIRTCLMLELETFPQQWPLLPIPSAYAQPSRHHHIFSAQLPVVSLVAALPVVAPHFTLLWPDAKDIWLHGIPLPSLVTSHRLVVKGRVLKMTIKGLES